MSPEQAVGGTATAASDRYGLAVVAFELLCGRRPYLAETFAAEAAAHARRRSRRRRASTGRCLPRSTPCSRARSRRTRRSATDRAASWSRISGLRSPKAPARRSGWPHRGADRGHRRAPRRSRHVSRRSGANVGIAAALGALALVGIVLAATVGGGGDTLPPTTVVRTATVAGETQVRTVTVEAQPANPPTTQGALPVTAASTPSGSALNDQGFRLLEAGDAAAALPILERAVAALQGSGSLTEAYASVQPCPRSVLDRQLRRRRGAARRLREDPGRSLRDQAAEAPGRQGLQG